MANVGIGYATTGNLQSIPQILLQMYSAQIEHIALPVMRFADFAAQKTDLEKGSGDSIVFTRFGNIARGGALMESKPIETKNLSASQYSVMVTEYGNGIEVSEKMLQLSSIDLLEEASFALGRDYAVTSDKMLRDTLLGTSNILFPNGRDSRSALIPETDELNTAIIESAVEWLSTNDAPKFNDDYYVCFAHPHQLASIRHDPSWIAAQNYNGTRALFNNEVGRWNDVIFVETTVMPNGAAASTAVSYDSSLVYAATNGGALSGANRGHVYQASIFGAGSYGWATALPVELRVGLPQDFGRRHSLAWYSIMGAALLHEDYALVIETT